ncbi:M23 family metallopeptidase [Novosphingobium album (ex Liu et al. 2023)]|uniref:M23 family metallopeptidase n=1 Tax=Novosphingobium album (ex Liu et al. 2023) TaxID=3031130 RepID=A0ABT5WP27_9SPHN|nr:M23 family metallopeptidase [Novosphingobium album (ex Liu et al. 2023)]MDE8651795.1 M23 family metallopeptidase [Novosphingobium album (ex Liu et al. 2023)]
MFKALETCGDGDRAGGAAGVAALSHAQVLAAAPRDASPVSRASFRERIDALRHGVESWCHRVDLAPDLAQDIGSGTWFRGLGTMVALGVVAIAFWPDLSAVEAATAMPVDHAVRDEFRSQMIMPLALGSDSGRHMGATPFVHALRNAPERPTVELVSTLGQGDSFARMLERAGLGAGDIGRVTQLVGNALPPGDIAPGTQFDITLGRRAAPGAPRALDSMDFRARFDLDLSIERGAGGLALVRHPITVDATPLRIRAPVGVSLYRSARNAGAPIAAIQSYLRTVDQHLSIENDLRADDQFDLVVEYKRSARGERQVGALLYAGLLRDGKPRLQLLRWGGDGQFFEASGIGRNESRVTGAPVAGRITSGFGMRRHPILGYVRMHAGIDFGAAYGSPIYAVSDGTVVYAGRHGGHGNYVRIDHGDGMGTGYAHMSRIAVAGGTHVRAGQVIGYVGSSGLSTGPHLHFEAYQGGRTINPLSIRFVSRPQIDGKEQAAFKARLAALMAVRPGAALGAIAPGGPVEAGPARAIGREIDRAALPRAVVAPAGPKP